MNKKDVLEKLKKELNLDDDKVNKINEIFESHFLIGKNNKEEILKELKEKLFFTDEDADNIYNKFISIIGRGLINKITHPFKSRD